MARVGEGWSATVQLGTGDYAFPTGGVVVQEMRVASNGLTAGTAYALRMQRRDDTYRDFQVFHGDVVMLNDDSLRRIKRVGTHALLHDGAIILSGYRAVATE